MCKDESFLKIPTQEQHEGLGATIKKQREYKAPRNTLNVVSDVRQSCLTGPVLSSFPDSARPCKPAISMYARNVLAALVVVGHASYQVVGECGCQNAVTFELQPIEIVCSGKTIRSTSTRFVAFGSLTYQAHPSIIHHVSRLTCYFFCHNQDYFHYLYRRPITHRQSSRRKSFQ